MDGEISQMNSSGYEHVRRTEIEDSDMDSDEADMILAGIYFGDDVITESADADAATTRSSKDESHIAGDNIGRGGGGREELDGAESEADGDDRHVDRTEVDASEGSSAWPDNIEDFEVIDADSDTSDDQYTHMMDRAYRRSSESEDESSGDGSGAVSAYTKKGSMVRVHARRGSGSSVAISSDEDDSSAESDSSVELKAKRGLDDRPVFNDGYLVTTTATDDTKKRGDIWAINSADKMRSFGGRPRYYTKRMQCSNCDQEGHGWRHCPAPKKKRPCVKCGSKEHQDRNCPDDICFRCMQPGHRAKDCRSRRSRGGPFEVCQRCYMRGHNEEFCSDIWRQYHHTTEEGVRLTRANLRPMDELYCYNCARRGHIGGECTKERANYNTPALLLSIASYDRVHHSKSKHRVAHKPKHEREEKQRRHSDPPPSKKRRTYEPEGNDDESFANGTGGNTQRVKNSTFSGHVTFSTPGKHRHQFFDDSLDNMSQPIPVESGDDNSVIDVTPSKKKSKKSKKRKAEQQRVEEDEEEADVVEPSPVGKKKKKKKNLTPQQQTPPQSQKKKKKKKKQIEQWEILDNGTVGGVDETAHGNREVEFTPMEESTPTHLSHRRLKAAKVHLNANHTFPPFNARGRGRGGGGRGRGGRGGGGFNKGGNTAAPHKEWHKQSSRIHNGSRGSVPHYNGQKLQGKSYPPHHNQRAGGTPHGDHHGDSLHNSSYHGNRGRGNHYYGASHPDDSYHGSRDASYHESHDASYHGNHDTSYHGNHDASYHGNHDASYHAHHNTSYHGRRDRDGGYFNHGDGRGGRSNDKWSDNHQKRNNFKHHHRGGRGGGGGNERDISMPARGRRSRGFHMSARGNGILAGDQ